MRKNIWTKLIIPTLGLLILSGVGITTLKTAEPVETKAVSYHSLVGSMNGWNLSNRDYPLESIGGDLHEGHFVLDANVTFKVNKGNGTSWSGQDKGWDKVVDSGSRKDGKVTSDGSNIKVVTKYHFRIQFNSSTDAITINLYRQAGRSSGIDKNHMRLFFYRGSYEVDEALNCIQYGNTIDGGTLIIEPSGWIQNTKTGIWYAYFDVPINDFVSGTTKICMARVSANRGEIWNSSAQVTWTTGDNNYMFFVGDSWSHTLTKGILSDVAGSINVNFLKVVLEGYLTCSSSVVNGYGAFDQMNKTFFVQANGDWKIDGSLGNISLLDYASGDTNYSGSKTYTVTGWDKYSKMMSMYETGGAGATTIIPPNDNSSSNTTGAIIISVLLSFTVIGGLYFVKRKKRLA